MKRFAILGLVVCLALASNLSELASDQAEARLIEEWNACSQLCIQGCKARFGISQYNLCFEYACGCKLLEVVPEETPAQESSEAEVKIADTSEFEVIDSGSLAVVLSVGVILVWIIGLIAWNSIQKKQQKVEQPEILVLDDNDHYQRLY